MNWITNRKSTSRSRISRKSSKVFFECVRDGSHKTVTNAVRRPRCVNDNRSRDLVHLDCVVNTKRSSRAVYSGSEINTGTSGLMPRRARNKSDGNPRNYGDALHLPNASAMTEHPTLDIAGTTDEASKGLFPESSRSDFDIHRIRRRHFDRQPSHQSTPIDQFPGQIPRHGLSSERQRGSGFGNFNVHRLHEPWSSSQQSSRDSHLSRQGSRDFTSFDESRQFPTLAGMDFQQRFGVPTTGMFQSCNQSNFSLENELYNNTREHPDSPRSFGIQHHVSRTFRFDKCSLIQSGLPEEDQHSLGTSFAAKLSASVENLIYPAGSQRSTSSYFPTCAQNSEEVLPTEFRTESWIENTLRARGINNLECMRDEGATLSFLNGNDPLPWSNGRGKGIPEAAIETGFYQQDLRTVKPSSQTCTAMPQTSTSVYNLPLSPPGSKTISMVADSADIPIEQQKQSDIPSLSTPATENATTQTVHTLPSIDQQIQTDCSELLVDGGWDTSADTPVTLPDVCSKKRRSVRFKKNATL